MGGMDNRKRSGVYGTLWTLCCRSKDDIKDIHGKMMAEIEEAGGRIDRIYYCPDLEEEGSPCRKPEIGMALWAKRDFPEIDFKKAITS